MEQSNTFRNTEMLNWMGFFSEKLNVSPEKIHPMNVCDRKKNVIPLIESHKRVMIFADQSHSDLCYELWEAGLIAQITVTRRVQGTDRNRYSTGL